MTGSKVRVVQVGTEQNRPQNPRTEQNRAICVVKSREAVCVIVQNLLKTWDEGSALAFWEWSSTEVYSLAQPERPDGRVLPTAPLVYSTGQALVTEETCRKRLLEFL